MIDKGYPDPLYSLDLLARAARPQTPSAQAAIVVPEGLLVVRPELQLRGGKTSTEACHHGLTVALDFYDQYGLGLERHGLTPVWSAGLRRWGALLLDWDAGRCCVDGRISELHQRQTAVLQEGRVQLRRLRLTVELAGLAGLVRVAPVAERGADLLRQIEAAHLQASQPAEAAALADFGFHPAQLAALQALGAKVTALRQQLLAEELERRRLSDALAVVRGAIIGDLSRMSRLVQEYYPPEIARRLQMGRLLQRPRRRPDPAPADPPPAPEDPPPA